MRVALRVRSSIDAAGLIAFTLGCSVLIGAFGRPSPACAERAPVYDEFGLVPETGEGDLFLPDEVLDPEWPMPEARSRTTPDGGINDEIGESESDDPDPGWDEPGEGTGDGSDWAIRAGRAAREAGRAAAPGRTRPAPWGGPDGDPYRNAPPWGDEDVDPLGDLNGVDDHYLDPGEW